MKIFSESSTYSSLDDLSVVLDGLDESAQVVFVVGRDSFVQSSASELLETISQSDSRLRAPAVTLTGTKSSVADYLTFIKKLEVEAVTPGKALYLIAIGGGRVIDGAKIIAHHWLADNHAARPLIYIVAVPSTAGSGSEATRFAVCWDGDRKMSLDHEYLRPIAAILDYRLCIAAPVYQLATSGVDALCQGIEALLNVNAIPESDAFAYQAVSTAVEVLPRLIACRDRKSMNAMLQAAHFAGRAIDHTRTTAPHAFSYYLTSKFGIAHGHAVALGMAKYLEIFSIEVEQSRNLKEAYGAKLRWLATHLDGNCLGFARSWDRFLGEIGLEPTLDRTLSAPLPKSIEPMVDKDRLANSPIARQIANFDHIYRHENDWLFIPPI